jgi:phosphohistidine phosphatase SixA
MSKHNRFAHVRSLLFAALVVATAGTAYAGSLTGAALVDTLRHGGYVLVMRHANSPVAAPDKSTANPDNTKLERQLDEAGRNTARAMGEAIRQLHIPVGDVFSSPTYRALEAVRVAGLGKPKTYTELDEGAQGMQSGADPKKSSWLRAQAAERPRAGTNTFIVTHTPNLVDAFGEDTGRVAAGEALVFHPDGKGGTDLVARIKIEEWPQLEGAK